MKYFVSLLVVTILSVISIKISYAQIGIRESVKSIIEDRDLKLGFAIYNFDTGESVAINRHDKFPMQSVYKFPIALALLDKVDNGVLTLSDTILIDKKDLHPNTWSPLRDDFPNGANITVAELVRYIIKFSDNNGSDIALGLAGGSDGVQRYLSTHGIRDIKVSSSELEMQASWGVQYDNWAKPKEIVDLLRLFYSREMLQSKSYDCLWDVIASTQSGSIRRLLPFDAQVAYKTGYSGVGKGGVIAAQNCIGMMKTIDGSMVAFAIFITDSKESAEVNYSVIAEIGARIYAW